MANTQPDEYNWLIKTSLGCYLAASQRTNISGALCEVSAEWLSPAWHDPTTKKWMPLDIDDVYPTAVFSFACIEVFSLEAAVSNGRGKNSSVPEPPDADAPDPYGYGAYGGPFGGFP